MTLQQLRYVVMVAETGTITEAAEKLYISQPSLTSAIRELEKIELIRQSDRGYRMDYAVMATQKEILKAFNMTAANIRTQAAAMNEDLMQKRDELRSKELMEAFARSERSFEEVMRFLSGNEVDDE